MIYRERIKFFRLKRRLVNEQGRCRQLLCIKVRDRFRI